MGMQEMAGVNPRNVCMPGAVTGMFAGGWINPTGFQE